MDIKCTIMCHKCLEHYIYIYVIHSSFSSIFQIRDEYSDYFISLKSLISFTSRYSLFLFFANPCHFMLNVTFLWQYEIQTFSVSREKFPERGEGESSARVIVARNFNPPLASSSFPVFPFTVGALFRPGKREADKKLQNGKQRILARLSGSPAAYTGVVLSFIPVRNGAATFPSSSIQRK